MKLGLVGGRRSPDLGCLKREIEDRGHKATIISPRRFPRYDLGLIASGGAEGASTRADHVDLAEFACFYIHEFDLRDRFFRGEFDRATWVSLRERYLEFSHSEPENLAFQMSLILSLGEARPAINPPRALLASRLRPWIFFRLARAGLPVAPYRLAPAASDGSVSKRLRIGEDYYYDVPCFPMELEGVISLATGRPAEVWRILAVAQSEPAAKMIIENGAVRSASQPRDAGDLALGVLAALGLEVAEIQLAPYTGGLKVVDVIPSPRASEFEDVTGERHAGAIAERLLRLGGEA